MADSTSFLEGGLDVFGQPADGQIPKFIAARSRAEWVTPSSGGGSLGICAVGFTVNTETLTNPRILPFNTVPVNQGGFTVDTAYNKSAQIGTAIKVPANGTYRFGIHGSMDKILTNPSTSGHVDWDSVSREPEVEIFCDGATPAYAAYRWIDLALFGASGWNWVGDTSLVDVTIVSPPFTLTANEPIITAVNLDTPGVLTSLKAWGNNGFQMWVERLT